MKRNLRTWMAAVTLGAGLAAAPVAWGQTVDAGLARQQQLEQERKQKEAPRMELAKYIGMDVHRSTVVVNVRDSLGKVDILRRP